MSTEITPENKDAIFYWQDRLAKFFPTSQGPTNTEIVMFNAGRDLANERAKSLVETLEFYAGAFKKKLTGSMMGEFTPFLVDRGARAVAAIKQWKDSP